MSYNLQPLADRILIKPTEADNTTESGLILVQDHTPENSGTVVAVPHRCGVQCPECDAKVFIEPSVKVGDVVLFGYDAGQEITLESERYLLIRDTDLIAVLSTTEEEVTHG